MLIFEDVKSKRLLFLNFIGDFIEPIYILVSKAIKDDFLSISDTKPEILSLLTIKLKKVLIELDQLITNLLMFFLELLLLFHLFLLCFSEFSFDLFILLLILQLLLMLVLQLLSFYLVIINQSLVLQTILECF